MEGWWAPLTPTASPLPPTRVPPPPATPRCHCRPLSNSYNVLPRYDGWTDAEDVDSTVEILRDRELRSLHRMVPALKRRELDTRAIKSHFYPEGGWGWIVCGAAFLAHLLSTGLQLAYGGLHVYAIKHLGPAGNHAVWAGAICVGVSRVVGAMVSVRRQGPRVIAVIGGVILPLACLFTSFATQLHQVLLSYGVVLGIGCGLVREAAGLVLGAYFRKRRQFVELVAHAGAGVGIALFSVAFKEALGKLGWRLGLQAITGVLMTAFFLSTVYRSATLYHPQRPAILHLKNQRRKVKEKRPKSRKPFFDFTPLRSRPACMLFMAVGVAAFGLYTPVFFLASQGLQEGLEESALVLLQTFLGFATVLGTAGFGLVLVRPSTQCLISKQYLCQTAMLGLGISTLALSSIEEYHGYMLFSWMYGLCLGGFLYSIKMLTMERVRGKHFAKVWGFVQGAEAIPVIVGIPVTGYINEQNAKTGFYFSTAATLAGALLLSFVGFSKRESDHTIPPTVQTPIAEVCPCLSPQFHREPSWCGCSVGGTTAYCTWQRNCNKLPKSLSYAAPLNRPCCPSVYCRDCYLRPYSVPLRSSRSVPEGLAQRNNTWSRGGSCRMPCRRREHQLIEQITTSV